MGSPFHALDQFTDPFLALPWMHSLPVPRRFLGVRTRYALDLSHYGRCHNEATAQAGQQCLLTALTRLASLDSHMTPSVRAE